MTGSNSTSTPLVRFGHLTFALVLFVFAGAAHAVPTTCSDLADGDASTAPGGLSTSDVKFDGAASDDCYGVLSGNPETADANTAWGSLFGGGSFSGVVKSEGGLESGSFGGLDFMLTADTTTNDGGFMLFWDCNGGCPTVLDVVFGTKASNSSALYLFDDLVFAAELGDGGIGSGHFTISFANGGDQLPNLSNFVMFAREGTAVPEPGTLALLGTGLLLLGMRGRKIRA